MIDSKLVATEVERFLQDNADYEPFSELPDSVVGSTSEVSSLLIQLRLPSEPPAADVADVLNYLQGVIWGVGAHAQRTHSSVPSPIEVDWDRHYAEFELQVIELSDGSLRILARLDPRRWSSRNRQYAAFVLSGVFTVSGLVGGWAWAAIPAWAVTALALPMPAPRPLDLTPAPMGPVVEVSVSDSSDPDDVRVPRTPH